MARCWESFCSGCLPRANERGATVALFCGFAVELYFWLGTTIPWTWYVLIGSIVTFAIGYAASLFSPCR